MITRYLWKETIYSIKHDYFTDDIYIFIPFVVLVITTPIFVILDVLLIPMEILYIIFKKIKESEMRDE